MHSSLPQSSLDVKTPGPRPLVVDTSNALDFHWGIENSHAATSHPQVGSQPTQQNAVQELVRIVRTVQSN
jgi:hypothetical protein